MRVWVILLVVLVAGCAEGGGRDVLRALIWPIPLLDDGPPADRHARARWDEEPEAVRPRGASMALTLGSRQAVAALVSEQGERRVWRSGGGVVIATEGARVVATSGFSDVLVATRFEGTDPLDDPRGLLAREGRVRRVVDLMGADREPERMRFGLILDCRLRGEEEEGAVMVTEECQGDARVTNRFWVHPATGAVFRSVQWVGQRMAPLEVAFRDSPSN